VQKPNPVPQQPAPLQKQVPAPIKIIEEKVVATP
jgi:hypothetical protein